MKLAVLSCLHANLAALEAVLHDIDQQGVDQMACLGDLVGYGPQPNEVVDRVRSLNIPVVQGCWDEDIVEGLNACECSYPSMLAEKRGRQAHEWTNQVITDETRAFLAGLPMALKDEQFNCCFVHGSPHSQHEYLMPETDAFLALERVLAGGADLLFCGHTHVPYVRTLNGADFQVKLRSAQTTDSGRSQQLHVALKRIVNAGSVGEPRHGRPNATYVIYERDTDRIALREVEYDYRQTCALIVERGLPPIFAWRLSKGLEFAEKADDPSHICER
jgi:predicted phosphodiesterase